MSVGSVLGREARLLIKEPRRIRFALQKEKWNSLRRIIKGERLGGEWEAGAVSRRRYSSYGAYMEHQKAKLDVPGTREWLGEYDGKYERVLRDRLAEDELMGRNALCLGARLGTEVRSFIDLGWFAVGIDLNPGEENRYVVAGDFHSVQYSDDSVDVVFTNSLDHCLEIGTVMAEVRRVLRPGGRFVVEALSGRMEGTEARSYESMHWDTVNDLLAEMAEFVVHGRRAIDYPWKGEHIVMSLVGHRHAAGEL